MLKAKLVAWALASSLLCSSCSLMLSAYEAPKVPQMAAFEQSNAFSLGAVDKDFYQNFHDPNLTAVIEKALEHNTDMAQSYLNVLNAAYQLGLSRTSLLPDVSAEASANLSKDMSGSSSSVRSSSSSLGLSYEVDLFSRLEAQRGAALESFRASGYDYLAMYLSVINSAAKAYWQLSYAKEALDLGTSELEDAKRRLEIIKARFEAGAADGLEYDTAKVDYLSVEQTYQSRVNSFANAKTALAYLLGTTPDDLIAAGALDDSMLPDVPASVPLELLQRRPDLKAYEARLRQAYYEADEAKLAYYPSITLSAGLSMGDAGSFGRFLSDPLGTLGALITFPFLNYADLYYEERSALTERESARLDFVDGYLSAVKEVSDAMEEVLYYKKLTVTTGQSYELARSNYRRYENRYRQGFSSLSDYLDAADALRSSAIAYLDAKRGQLTASMNLYACLGGGLSDEDLVKILNEAQNDDIKERLETDKASP